MRKDPDPAITEERQEGVYGPIAAILVTIGVYFVSQVVAVVLIFMLLLLAGWDIERLQLWLKDSAAAKFVTILLVEVISLWLIWLFLQARKVPLKAIGLVAPAARDIGYAIAGFAAYFVLLVGSTVVIELLIPGLNLDQEQEIGFSRETTGYALWLVFASLVLLPAVTEEIITRGFLYTGLRSKLHFLTAAIITSALFAVAHLQWGSGNALLWAAAVDTFILSMILVYLREKTGSLWSPIAVHMIKNGYAFLLLFVIKIT